VLVPLSRPCKALAEPCTSGTPVPVPSFGHGSVIRSPPRVPSHARVSWISGVSTCAVASIAKGTIDLRGTVMPRGDAATAGKPATLAGDRAGRRMLADFGQATISVPAGHCCPDSFPIGRLRSCIRLAAEKSTTTPACRNTRGVPTRLQGRWLSRVRVLHGWVGHRETPVSAGISTSAPSGHASGNSSHHEGSTTFLDPRRCRNISEPGTGFHPGTESPSRAIPPTPGGWRWWYTDACRRFSGSG
jgi:hypothetical protein